MKGDTHTTAESIVVDENITPSKKKLKQARLPFQVISPSVHTSPAARKRKLSEQPDEIQNKVGKIFKENDVKNSPVESVVLISDDEDDESTKALPVSQDGQVLNPYVKIVDIALKRKLRKCKTVTTPKSRKSLKNKNLTKKIKNHNGVDENDSEETETKVKDTEVIFTETDPEKINGNEIKHNELKLNAVETEEHKLNHAEPIEIDKDIEQSDKTDDNQVETAKSEEELTNSNCINGKLSIEEETKDEELLEVHKDCQDDSKSDSEVESVSEDSNNDASDKESPSLSNNLDLSLTATPNEKRKRIAMETTPSTKANETSSPLNKSLTPKQVQKKLESVKKREEKERERIEREKKRQEEKEERTKQRLEKEEQKRKEREEKEEVKRKEREEKEEQKKKEREEKEEQKKKEKEERDRQREKEKRDREEKEEQKKKEKEEKEEQKRKEKEAKEEERKKRQEALDDEKKQKEIDRLEAEIKKKKAAAAFVNFFVPKQKGEQDNDVYTDIVENKTSVLSTFMVKTDMRLAPLKRYNLANEEKMSLDQALTKQERGITELYVSQLKDGAIKAKKGMKTWPLEEFKNDVIICEPEDDMPPELESNCVLECTAGVSVNGEKLRAKLLGFCENRRPPYWGTWRKRSTTVHARRPFAKDEKALDYTCDSDEEWEEVEGESLSGSVAGSDDEQEGDEYEVDNEFFVPHGYLSDEEAVGEEEDVMSLSPETQKAKLKYLEDEFESEMKKPTERLKPRLYGIIWETQDAGKPDNCIDALWNYLSKMSMIVGDTEALMKPPIVEAKKTNKPEKIEKVANANEKKKVPLLMSVPRGQTIPQGARNNLLTKFIKVAPQKAEQSESIDLTDEPKPIQEEQKETPKEKKRISLLMSVPIGQDIPAGSRTPSAAHKHTGHNDIQQSETGKTTKIETTKTEKRSNTNVEKKEKKRVHLQTSGPRDRKLSPAIKNNLLTSFIKKDMRENEKSIEKPIDTNCKIVSEPMEVDIVLSD